MGKKRIGALVALLTFAVGLEVNKAWFSHKPLTREQCPEGTILLIPQPGSPALLTATDMSCGNAFIRATIRLKNVSSKTISSYEIADREDYENVKGGLTTQGVTGVSLRPGESIELSVNSGYQNGLSYGRPVGELKHGWVMVSRIEFTDGSSWEQSVKTLE